MSARHYSFLSWPLLVFIIVTIAVLLSGDRTLQDGDTYMHIGIGEWIITHQSVPKVDVFSHTMSGQPWKAHEWLSEVILALSYKLGGWTGLVFLTGLCTAATVALLLRFMLFSVVPLYAIGFSLLSYCGIVTHMVARPHVLTWPLIVLWAWGLVDACEKKRRPSWLLLLVMVLWANLHGGFVLGLAIITPFAIESVVGADPDECFNVCRRWVEFIVAAFLSALINPIGWHVYEFFFHLMNNGYLKNISEWRMTKLAEDLDLLLWLNTLLMLSMLGMLRLPVVRIVFILVLFYEALLFVRYISIFAILIPFVIATPFGAGYKTWLSGFGSRSSLGSKTSQKLDFWFETFARPSSWVAKSAGFCLVLLVALWAYYFNKNEPNNGIVPERAVNQILAKGVTGNVLNTAGSGGYLILKGIPVYVDGRADLYGSEFMQRYTEILSITSPDALSSVLNSTHISWVLMPNGANLSKQMASVKGWEEFYADQSAVVYRRANIKK